MSRELTKMNLIAIVQQLPKEHIEVIETYIKMIEQENQQLKEELQKANDTLDTHNELINHLQEFVEEQKKVFEEWLEPKVVYAYEDVLFKMQELDKREG